MKTKLILLAAIFIGQFANAQMNENLKSVNQIPVLNMGTFHMGYTSDAQSTEFNENDEKNKQMVHEVARAIAAFKPTVIIVEQKAIYDEELNKLYQEYLKDPKMKIKDPNEVHLLGFELGRLAGVKKIYGIDHSMGYNYKIPNQIGEYNDKELYDSFMESALTLLRSRDKEKDVRRMLYNINTKLELDALLNLNADMLTHASTPGKSEGADQAARYYHRNLIMYSNLNQIPLTKDDRVFILMGGSHTAFFNMWLERSPKYQLVNTLDYLKEFK
ncbi:hypothetical protein HX039_11485 [Myroides marinus]|uniref:DUF5694 domain-containing protein n=1 Tax=Myroides marinus TaxID=703342 RepID=UPI0025773E29|nr:DUF5694 domain-containing protein [Myroides marinus]MDM1404726.1 hypothetical protein [Myroides marinus]